MTVAFPGYLTVRRKKKFPAGPADMRTNMVFDDDRTQLQELCARLHWDFGLLCQIAAEWEARNSSDASMFGFDSTIFFCETVWGVEKCRRSQWTSSIQLKYTEAFNQVYLDVRSCLRPIDSKGKGEGSSAIVPFFEAQSVEQHHSPSQHLPNSE
ncbi:uncharacterized protein Z520_03599 [Fonsecaea multimorphosa CBS 102226]|uniref:Uncharacterized protein n=1 Tax=Fonsecaea multimorphosa CBS 102226 TaxID=1442371 RepID=A0A0D2K578_9EURO|nr:uncharacterized protein Z520_03599 [Fonsecaea multimorphosa CBS 102226]KIY00933.1 hypothetical protein Z520_03599 [Fonsecaea multimorphosa CBS 102226]